MISGESEFNEVFYTDAVCPKENVVGGVNDGWRVAMTLLGFERGEAAATQPIRFQAEVDRLLLLAKERGVADDPRGPPEARVGVLDGADHAVQRHARAHPVPAGAPSRSRRRDLEAVLERVPQARHRDRRRHLRRRGHDDQRSPPSSAFASDDAGAPNTTGSWVNTFLNARAGTIYAGSSQIQRNIIGEMVLGLPKEPKPG
jgi:alkylation response protein AidB-like acyl-CoA dehydrogenase